MVKVIATVWATIFLEYVIASLVWYIKKCLIWILLFGEYTFENLRPRPKDTGDFSLYS